MLLIDGKPALRIVGGIWIRAARQPMGLLLTARHLA
jgi:hypothetical protein